MTWAFLWAYGRYDLGLSESEFWSLTPREYGYLADRAKAKIRWEDLRHALAPYILACAYSPPKKKWTLEDFVIGSMNGGSTEAADSEPDSNSLLSKANALFGSMGGRRGDDSS